MTTDPHSEPPRPRRRKTRLRIFDPRDSALGRTPAPKPTDPGQLNATLQRRAASREALVRELGEQAYSAHQDYLEAGPAAIADGEGIHRATAKRREDRKRKDSAQKILAGVVWSLLRHSMTPCLVDPRCGLIRLVPPRRGTTARLHIVTIRVISPAEGKDAVLKFLREKSTELEAADTFLFAQRDSGNWVLALCEGPTTAGGDGAAIPPQGACLSVAQFLESGRTAA